MLLSLPVELLELILSFLTRKEYKESVPCKDLLLCKSYLPIEEFAKKKEPPKINLSLQELENLLIKSCRTGNVWLVKVLITKFKVDPSADDNYIIYVAFFHVHLEVVKRLLKDPRVDPSIDNNRAIRWASSNGHLEIVEKLLQDPRVDPSDCVNAAIYCASERGHIKVVERLLQDPRVDPSDWYNQAICYASRNGHLAVVERLLKDPRVDPSDDHNRAVRWASSNGHLDVMEILLSDYRIDSSVRDDYHLRMIAIKNNEREFKIRFKKLLVDYEEYFRSI